MKLAQPFYFHLFIDAFNEAQFLYDARIHMHLKGKAFELCKRYKLIILEQEELLKDGRTLSEEEQEQSNQILKRKASLQEELIEEEKVLLNLFEPFLQLSQ